MPYCPPVEVKAQPQLISAHETIKPEIKSVPYCPPVPVSVQGQQQISSVNVPKPLELQGTYKPEPPKPAPYCPPVQVQVQERPQIEVPRQNQQIKVQQSTGSRPISEQKGAIFSNPPQVVDSISYSQGGKAMIS